MHDVQRVAVMARKQRPSREKEIKDETLSIHRLLAILWIPMHRWMRVDGLEQTGCDLPT